MSMSQGMTSQRPLEQMSDAELQAELDRALGQLEGAISGAEAAPADAPMSEPAAPVAAPVAEPMSADGMLGTVEPDAVQQATARMVSMGLLPAATSDITPDILMAFQLIIDAIDPGLYDLQQPEQLKEFIDGVNSGAIDLAIAVNRARELAGTAGGAIPTGAGVPIGAAAGFVPGGNFGPAGAAPAGIPAGPPRPI